eukprot:3899521-Prymnesium_polylepis.1
MTLLEANSAPDGSGSSIYLGPTSTLLYTLPAPPGRWLNIRQGVTFSLDAGAEDLDLPYACSAGVIGGSLAEDQSGPGCSRTWCAAPSTTSLPRCAQADGFLLCCSPAGSLCPAATTQPLPCPQGTFVRGPAPLEPAPP